MSQAGEDLFIGYILVVPRPRIGVLPTILRFLTRVLGGQGLLFPFFQKGFLEAVTTRDPKRASSGDSIWPSSLDKGGAAATPGKRKEKNNRKGVRVRDQAAAKHRVISEKKTTDLRSHGHLQTRRTRTAQSSQCKEHHMSWTLSQGGETVSGMVHEGTKRPS